MNFGQTNQINTTGGRPCPDGFRYSSDSNPKWLNEDDLNEMIGMSELIITSKS